MRRANVRDAVLEFDFNGAGEPILLIHGTLLADSMLPFAQQPALFKRHLVIRYHRRGYGGSSRIDLPWSFAQHAMDAAGLLEQLGVRKTHVVGHSSGAAVALELALNFPHLVGSVVLLELGLNSSPSAGKVKAQLTHAEALYRRGDSTAAIQNVLSVLAGPEYHGAIDQALPPGTFAAVVKDADTVFLHELPAMDVWELTRPVAMRMFNPVLIATGSRTMPLFAESRALLSEWLPDAEIIEIPDAGHALQLQAPDRVVAAVLEFLARNPLATSALV
jgi:pimeloyl-ACP methyl ester carboxylesterase